MEFRITPRAFFAAGLVALAGPVAADGHCPDFGFSSAYLNDFFCSQLDELSQGEPTVPTRNVVVPDDAEQQFIDEFQIVQEAFQADPRSTLDLLNRIRSAGGTTAE